MLQRYEKPIRQRLIKGLGHDLSTVMTTNQMTRSALSYLRQILWMDLAVELLQLGYTAKSRGTVTLTDESIKAGEHPCTEQAEVS